MAKPAKNVLAKVPPKAQSIAVDKKLGEMPAHIAAAAGKGGQGVVGYKSEDFIIPRMDLMQDISPAVQAGDFEAGEFVHNVLEESFGPSMDVIVLIARKQYTLWRPRHDGDGGILARADDGVHWVPPNGSWTIQPHKGMKKTVTWRTARTVEESGLAAWGSTDPDESDSPPAANEMATIVALPVGRLNLGPVVFALQRGSLTTGKKFVQRLAFDDVPSTAKIYKVEAVRASNDKGDGFWSYKFSPQGWVEDKAVYEMAEKMQKRFLEMGFKIKDEEKLRDEQAGMTGEEASKKYKV